jgi:hypothetical protein
MPVSVEILAAGDGINYPRKGQTVTVHYTGALEHALSGLLACLCTLPRPTSLIRRVICSHLLQVTWKMGVSLIQAEKG